MMSESEYNDMIKAGRNADYLTMLDKSMAEAEAGGFIIKTVDELELYSSFFSDQFHITVDKMILE